MTDRELLELAAKAAGYDIDWNDWRDCGSHIEYRMRGTTRYWNPLPSDGDALRLAVKLNIDFSGNDYDIGFTDRWAQAVYGDNKAVQEPYGTDPYAATRRAIVRAAAAIGESMK